MAPLSSWWVQANAFDVAGKKAAVLGAQSLFSSIWMTFEEENGKSFAKQVMGGVSPIFFGLSACPKCPTLWSCIFTVHVGRGMVGTGLGKQW